MTKEAEFVRNLISDFEINVKPIMHAADMYYKTKNLAVLNRQQQLNTLIKAKKTDTKRANNVLVSSFFKSIVDQKVNFSINENLKIDNPDKVEIPFAEDNKFNKKLKKLAKSASKYIRAAYYIYIDEMTGDFAYKPVHGFQFVPYFENEQLVKAVKYYSEDRINGNKTYTVTIAELWDDEKVTYFVKDENNDAGNYKLDQNASYRSENPVFHITTTITQAGTEVPGPGQGWGKPPFVILENNDEQMSDLEPIKTWIDCFDFTASDLWNNLDEFREIYWILKNYQGQDPDEFFEQLNRYKLLKVGEDGDAKPHTTEIPTNAREVMLEECKSNIYKFGQAVDVSNLSGDITTVEIQAMYNELNLKANDFEIEIQDAFDQLLWFYNKYLEIKNLPQVDTSKVELEFQRSVISNENENIKIANESQGAMPETLRLKKYGIPDDQIEEAKEEMKEMQGLTLGG